MLEKASGRDKLAPRSTRCILVGYGDDAGTYRLYDPIKRAVVLSRDVVFNEEGFIRAHYLPFRDYYGDVSTSKGDFGLPEPLPAELGPAPESLPDELVEADVGWVTLETKEKIKVPETFEEMLESAHFSYWWDARRKRLML